MHYLIVSFTYKNTEIETREKLAFSNDEKLQDGHSKILCFEKVNEVVILSTCNRVEIICSVSELSNSADFILKYLSTFSHVSLDELESRADIYEDTGAIFHLFSVASSLDSLVIGETQIVGQLKNAFKFSFENGFCAQKLSRAMNFAFRCAANVRSSTDISKSPVSISSVAVSKAKEIFGDLHEKTAVVVGAGEMSELACKHLSTQGASIILLNRNVQKAQNIADALECEVRVDAFENLPVYINQYDLVFTATSANDFVITQEIVRPCEFQRYWFDIAVPRDIDDFDDERIHIFAVDDLRGIVDKNQATREEQAKNAIAIIRQFTNDFYKWLQSLSVDPIIKELRQKAKDASEKEIQKAISKGYLDPSQHKNFSKIVHNIFNTFLHTPTQKLKSIAEHPSSDVAVESLQYFFDIEDEIVAIKKEDCSC